MKARMLGISIVVMICCIGEERCRTAEPNAGADIGVEGVQSQVGKYNKPWSEQELNIVNGLIDKNATGGYVNLGKWLAGENNDVVLRGLKKVQLHIEAMATRDEKVGIREIVTVDIRQQLEQAGIEVVPFWLTSEGISVRLADRETPILCVSVPVFNHNRLHICSYRTSRVG